MRFHAVSLKDKEKWDHKYEDSRVYNWQGACRMAERITQDILDGKGSALDIASGEGRNAVFAAEKGYGTLAVDISTKGLEKAHALADEKGVSIETCN